MDVILGAGMAGLGAYYANPQSVIYEKMQLPGGLCSGFEIDGYHFDQAVHLSFTNNETVRSVFNKRKYFIHKPESKSWYHEKWLKHPAQNNLFPCNVEDKIDAIKSFIERKTQNDSSNFEEWTKSQYGEWLYKNMFLPYNQKYWCIDLKNLGTNWIGNRMYRPTLDEILNGAFTDETPNTYYAKEMRYPENGGYIDFVKEIIDEANKSENLFCGKEVKKIDIVNKIVTFTDGEQIYYDCLFSSIPLTEMPKLVTDMPEEIKISISRLEYTCVAIVSIGFNCRLDFDSMWCYFYDDDILAARAYMPSIKSPNNAPEGKSSIQFEIYFNSKDTCPDMEKCIDNCKYALEKTGIARESQIQLIDFRVIPFGNIVFKHGTEEIAEHATLWLRKKDIMPIGRFGEWKYYWSDQAFMSGYEASILHNKKMHSVRFF